MNPKASYIMNNMSYSKNVLDIIKGINSLSNIEKLQLNEMMGRNIFPAIAEEKLQTVVYKTTEVQTESKNKDVCSPESDTPIKGVRPIQSAPSKFGLKEEDIEKINTAIDIIYYFCEKHSKKYSACISNLKKTNTLFKYECSNEHNYKHIFGKCFYNHRKSNERKSYMKYDDMKNACYYINEMYSKFPTEDMDEITLKPYME